MLVESERRKIIITVGENSNLCSHSEYQYEESRRNKIKSVICSNYVPPSHRAKDMTLYSTDMSTVLLS